MESAQSLGVAFEGRPQLWPVQRAVCRLQEYIAAIVSEVHGHFATVHARQQLCTPMSAGVYVRRLRFTSETTVCHVFTCAVQALVVDNFKFSHWLPHACMEPSGHCGSTLLAYPTSIYEYGNSCLYAKSC